MSNQSTAAVLAADIVRTIAANPGITVPEIAATLGVSPSVVYGTMPTLSEAIVKVDRQFYPPGGEPQPPAPPQLAPPAPVAAQPPPPEGSGTLVITHTNDEGTLVHGTQRDDGSREALRIARFKWSRNLRSWYLPSSRGRAARRGSIEHLQSLLETAGFTVNVEIAEYDPAQAFEALQAHGEERAEMHAGRADRENARSDTRYRASHDAVRGIEPGQPILVGHHSQRRHEKDLSRSHAHMSASVAHTRRAERSEGRAAEVQRRTERRTDPVVMGRRIERLEKDQRSLERLLKGAGEAPRRRAELADIVAEIAFLKQQVVASGVKQYTKADLQPGDAVKIRGSWREVVKPNPKTVAVKTGYSWTDTYPYYEITAHHRPGATPPASQ